MPAFELDTFGGTEGGDGREAREKYEGGGSGEGMETGDGGISLLRVCTIGVQPDAAPATSPIGLAHVGAAVTTTRFTTNQIPPRWRCE